MEITVTKQQQDARDLTALRQELCRLCGEFRSNQEWHIAQLLDYAYQHVATAEPQTIGAQLDAIALAQLG